MSGLEIAGLAVGVLPILFEVVKSYSIIRDKIRTFRRCNQELEDVFVEFKAIRVIFFNEVRLLLRSMEIKKQVKLDLEECNNRRWANQETEDRFRAVLQDNYDACREIIQHISRYLEEIASELENFEPFLSQKLPTESIRSVYKRLSKSLKFTFNKSRYDKCLTSLRDRNSELISLRSQVVAIEQQEVPSGVCIQHVPLPSRFKTIQTVSRKLHESLCGAWRCNQPTHCGHDAKLCLDADAKHDVTLDLAISCRESSYVNSSCLLPESTIWLFVQSTSISADTLPDTPKIQDSLDMCSEIALELLNPVVSSSSKTLKKKASCDLSKDSAPKKKARRVQFQVSTSPLPAKVPNADVPGTLFTFGVDLCKTKSICDYLRECYEARLLKSAKECIGYLDSAQMYKHLFYLKERKSKPQLDNSASSTISKIQDALRQEVYDALQPEDRLKLAHRLAVATLQYNDTPWLPERWRLGDLSYLGSRSSFNVEALKTLHFNSQISRPATTADGQMEDIQQDTGTISEQTRYGINNTTLFFLGVAMLEIAYWTPIEEKMTNRDENNPVFAARRLVLDRGAPLGPEYQRIAQKCLECNFGFGTKLSNKGLQSAVYNDVVCQLDEMIERLERLSV
ncbi:hypothetical protein COCC4DRAFT_162540 [Bipolaris maydis ATCC 48331]|uniref:DUF7580 domain-containing protein n=2 Tax=Cochliobolus heterostrophus TaxID=5016 RepID=M2U1I7_COCH5|nr:uncharacterized protein COCC4DRAFT_162540 [Bipolaris maydis ATCC 48331]EMD92419.1 hypothetical protein COCHEDRAFT_1174336 [Bipolaris maydis C5]KAJ5022248.1 hypothetical protein J3E73DRAFT_219054 [Bipolaris maydis]ENI08109.1 hypothetical protein COCC4DRAFT_162540 [Bipolaris maydis ATCC 48331]KAJ5060938.1 hypothetical protein J3E74DRAFT_269231 [Bipolaris maydis]KAJ6198070.1 hypothetical protein J3E72DRAFT_240894 [Bipolaris maydis]